MRDDGGPAFPQYETGRSVLSGTECILMRGGMTLRDYFAAAALQGHCACMNILEKAMNEEECRLAWINAAAFSYRCADAMLAERTK